MTDMRVFRCAGLNGREAQVLALDGIDAKEVCWELHGFWPSEVREGSA